MMQDQHEQDAQLPRPALVLRKRAKELRRNATPAEQSLWHALRGKQLGVKFRRQHAVGRFIADFCCLEHRLIIEVDGAVHTHQAEYDAARTEVLSAAGFQVLRFTNQQVLHERPLVLARIRETVASRSPSDHPCDTDGPGE